LIDMSGVFNDLYADNYDLVYRAKNYELEIEAVSRLMSQYEKHPVRSVLDLGCGTGRHAILLAKRGLDVTGVDRSEPMLAHARERAAAQNAPGRTDFVRSDLRELDLGRQYDAALMMFNVVGYLCTNDDVLAAFRRTRRNLRDGGLFAFDFWYGPAVMADPPGTTMKELSTEKGALIRYSSGCLQPHEQRCDISIRLLRLEDGKLAADVEELHKVRYFFPLELDLALRASGFRLLTMRQFPRIDQQPSVDAWGTIAVAMAHGGPEAGGDPAPRGGR
jgi:SAM-dependent methyltransferase